jgi:hypothetical protein
MASPDAADPTSTEIADENRAAAAAFDGKQSFVAVAGTTPVPPRKSVVSTLIVFVMIAAGLAIVAAAMLLPLREENRQLTHDSLQLQREVDHLKRQIEVNRSFLSDIMTDPQLALRLAMRQNAPVETPGTRIDLGPGAKSPASQPFGQSPFQITYLPPPEPLPPYQSDLPRLAQAWFVDPSRRLLSIGVGVFFIAAGIILGAIPTRSRATA